MSFPTRGIRPAEKYLFSQMSRLPEISSYFFPFYVVDSDCRSLFPHRRPICLSLSGLMRQADFPAVTRSALEMAGGLCRNHWRDRKHILTRTSQELRSKLRQRLPVLRQKKCQKAWLPYRLPLQYDLSVPDILAAIDCHYPGVGPIRLMFQDEIRFGGCFPLQMEFSIH